MTFGVWVAILLTAIVVLFFVWLVRAEIRRSNAMDRKQAADRAAFETATDQQWAEEEADMQVEKALTVEIRALSWPDVRRRCEVATGKPCECDTKDLAAHRIHRATSVYWNT